MLFSRTEVQVFDALALQQAQEIKSNDARIVIKRQTIIKLSYFQQREHYWKSV
jgi:hypothetical protein